MHKIIKLILHLFFWLCYSLFSAGISFELKEGLGVLKQYIDIYTINFIWALLAFYFMYKFGYRLFEKHKFIAYFGTVALLSFLLSGFFYLLYSNIFSHKHLIDSQQFYTSLLGTFIIANCGSLLKGFIHWFDSGRLKAELEKRSLQHELESLKAQINPHFLFNTLNNIDALIHIKPSQASASLVQLSDILRYMLYSSEQEFISLLHEVNHIEKIIELQYLRLSDSKLVRFTNNITDNGVEVSPMLFTPFIENAFKYVVKSESSPAIGIEMDYNDSLISFRCWNYYDKDMPVRDSKTGGIGLKNVKRRLHLLYPAKHSLQINKENHIFEVTLNISTQ